MATEVVVPMLGITVEKGVIVEWLKQEGDRIEKGEIIFIVEVEKATTEVESPAAGVLAKILIPAGVEVPILTVAGVITEPGEQLPAGYESLQPGAPERAAAAGGAPAGTVGSPAASEIRVEAAVESHGPRVPRVAGVVPAARKLAGDKGVDLAGIDGSGPDRVILLRDVQAALTDRLQAPAPRVSTLARKLAQTQDVPLTGVVGTGVRGRIMRADVCAHGERAARTGPGLGTTIPMSRVRKIIARRMSESALTAPHIYFFTEVCFDALLAFRDEIVPDFERHFALRPSINDLLIKAVALNILDFPILNGQVNGEQIRIMSEINVGLAVAVAEGLVVPAVADADRVGLVDIIRQRVDLVSRAKAGKLSVAEMERGTFTVSSLAQYDITHFTAILNPPQSGILSVGKTGEKLVLVDGQVQVRRTAQLGLSVDHRIIDGATAADFLQNLKWKLERPAFTFLQL